MTDRPRVHITCLGGRERTSWANWGLVSTLLAMVQDQRFRTSIEVVSDLRNFDSARNYCIDSARKNQADWNIQIDNDIAPRVSPLQMIAEAESDMWVLGMVYGCYAPTGGIGLAGDGQTNRRSAFFEMQHLGGGCLAIKSNAWRRITPPWFVWKPRPDELLTPGIGEDFFFSDYCHANGVKLWGYWQAAQHLRTFDLTTALCQQAGGVQ